MKAKEELFTVKLEVLRREYEPGKKRTHDFEFDVETTGDYPNKYNLFIDCVRNFGRCAGKIPMGWKFEKVERFDDGSKRWVEYNVRVVSGGRPSPGFYLTHEEE